MIKQKQKQIITRISYAVAIVILSITIILCGQIRSTAFADTIYLGTRAEYENVNIWDDLQNSTIGGKPFDIADYPYDSNGKPQVLSFIEFCYSPYGDKQDDFGLYVYVYNPQQIKFDTENTVRNEITMAYGGSVLTHLRWIF